MKLPKNTFKSRLNIEKQYGCWAGLTTGYAAEILATVGYDWLLVDSEHAPNTTQSLLGQLQAIAPYHSHPIVRPESSDKDNIKRLLDIGVQTLMIPMVETAEQAKELVSAMHYPPKGIRGVGGGLARATRWDAIDNYLNIAGDELCLIVQIESSLGVKNAEEIANVDGVDAVFIGPADLSIGLGHPGNPYHGDVQSSISSVIDATLSAGKACGILAPVEADARKYMQMGCSFVAVGIDISLMRSAAKENLNKYLGARSKSNNSGTY
ncbi:2-dehydro-3-deoxyglucarate aldolase [Marinomonas rhizomae]|uniref:2,4-dihydroxyhept-2-enedioate aldolase n=1 Tax=Marinomonas rhizomae TaxID=491948 RepID=A0A366J918_9GAMM|nr:HpcH/HpaI aldolase/citrate lyase family protein [Marinomonas rhizomae]RBP83443.1 2,4-dihydroxyhept-2-enedioate aldolase [Marinomonas rhizomae]RNF73997.1 2-dehydro-3-deoxyglucarate aldolase [Marinomonas rhizomae]